MDVKEFFDNIAPRWDSLEHHTRADLLPFVAQAVDSGSKVLDLGCGTGIISCILHDDLHCDVTALDISAEMIALAKQKYADRPEIRFVCGDFFAFDEGGFDTVVVFNAYPHFTDQQAFADRLYQVLAPHGKFAILHNIGRATLDKCHDGAEQISRQLLPVQQEAELYATDYTILRAEETDDSYILIGEKK